MTLLPGKELLYDQGSQVLHVLMLANHPIRGQDDLGVLAEHSDAWVGLQGLHKDALVRCEHLVRVYHCYHLYAIYFTWRLRCLLYRLGTLYLDPSEKESIVFRSFWIH